MVTYTNTTLSSVPGNGSDPRNVTLENTTVTGNATLGGGNDILNINNGSDINGVVLAGEGNDKITMNSTSAVHGKQADGDSFDMGGGTDTVTISGTATVAGHIYMSSGADTITMTGGSVGGDLRGGIGADTFSISNATVTGNIYGDNNEADVASGGDTITLNNVTTSGTVFGEDNADSVTVGSLASNLIINGGEGGTDTDTLNLSALTGSIVYNAANSENGVFTEYNTGKTITFTNIEKITAPAAPPPPVCFTSGMAIETVDGEKLVDDLEIGDRVLTYDNGPQPIRYIYKRTTQLDPKTLPIRFEPGSIGNDRGIIVSQKHCFYTATLPKDVIPKPLLDTEDHLIHANMLVNGTSIRFDYSKKSVTYYHIMLDKHELIKCHGTWSESWHPIRRALKKDKAVKRELLHFFPEIRNQTKDNTPAVRELVTLNMNYQA